MTEDMARWRAILGDDVADAALAAGLAAPVPPDEAIDVLRQVFTGAGRDFGV